MITIVLFIFFGAIGYFALTQYLSAVQVASRDISESIGGIDSNYITADQFITSLVMFILAPAIFGLAIWVYTYNQRKNLEMGG